MRQLYPHGLGGRSVLDCACNCGGYLLWCGEFGASGGLGFDAREHWINQARFLAAARDEDPQAFRFEVCDLYDLPELKPGLFDIAIFKGIFYHLPDPVTGLRIVTERVRELVLLNTATWEGRPDGMLVAEEESREALMSGVYGLSWLPTGPDVLRRILRWLGFPATRLTFHKTDDDQAPNRGRLEILAARDERTFAAFDDANLKLRSEQRLTSKAPETKLVVPAEDTGA